MQKNNAFCSICTVNYTAYAGVLNESLRKVGHEDPHYVLLVDYDEKYKDIIEKFDFTSVFLHELAIPGIDELVEKYSSFELSNVLKPFFIEWLLKNHPETQNLIYLDTDIYVYSPLNEIFDYLDKNSDISIAITPHLRDYRIYNDISNYEAERLHILSGLYNGGFYAVKNDKNAIQFLNWQKNKLYNFGYDAPNAQMFVDQKILDFAPVFFEFIGIYKNKAYNVAHWNYNEHPIQLKSGKYFSGNKRLVFFHFSQLKIDKDDINKYALFSLSFQGKPVLQKMVLDYVECLRRNNHEKIKNIPYGFENEYKKPPLSFINPIWAKSIELDSTKNQLDSTKNQLDSTKNQLDSTKNQLDSTKNQLDSTKNQLDSTKNQLDSTKNQLDSTKAELEKIYLSREWKTGLFLRKIVKILIPKATLRRKIIVGSWNILKTSLRLMRKAKSKLLFRKSHLYKSLKLKNPRKINLNSRKIVYIGHSYHSKTKSTEFLIDYLKKSYNVKTILDDSWQGKPFPDLSFIDESYLGIIFFQNLPPKDILEKIKNDNLIYFPMYDGVRHDYEFWKDYENLKIINFSKTLHDKLKKWGFESMYVQYFPDFQKFIPGSKNEVFFWQRITKINIKTIIRLFGKEKLNIHIHKAIDPEHKFMKPSKEDEEKFHITYSDWFETREEMWDMIKQKGIYIAPRKLEGIGLSFLEAMAMGKAVIAVNNPTMNEYIKHGRNGYLFDLKKPKEIDFSNIEQVQKNTHEFMQEGRKKWEKDKEKIIDFIKKAK